MGQEIIMIIACDGTDCEVHLRVPYRSNSRQRRDAVIALGWGYITNLGGRPPMYLCPQCKEKWTVIQRAHSESINTFFSVPASEERNSFRRVGGPNSEIELPTPYNDSPDGLR